MRSGTSGWWSGPKASAALKTEHERQGGNPEALFRELRCGRAVNHPNVCRVFDVFEADGRWFLTMEYAAEGTPRSVIDFGRANACATDGWLRWNAVSKHAICASCGRRSSSMRIGARLCG